MATVNTKEIRKQFGDVVAVDGISLAASDGEFLVLLGPSGCGKTTLLRIISGLEKPTSGEVLIDGQVVNDLPPRARGIAMVFQSYGLYPHLTVWNNIAFPLKTQGVRRDEIKRKVEWASSLLGINRLAQRRPRQLSGGERQRVALARALVRDPTVFLLDEPLSNLDAKLRASARSELKQFQRTVRTATIYVTHDQVEAMGMGDRIAVIDHGKLRQVGTPAEIYDNPADEFVATFLGTPPMNLVERDGGSMGFRPENFLPKELLNGTPVVEFPFRIERIEYLGSEHILYGALDGRVAKREVTAKLPAHATLNGISPGAWHEFAVRETELRYFNRDGRRTGRP
ncbi:MAG TPA: ABC transporter ATP-binding protein [Xanthobacteraceae bacterium]|nr:ABC transporter ATP-binding protein [Xanthobacteraceae bacterium]